MRLAPLGSHDPQACTLLLSRRLAAPVVYARKHVILTCSHGIFNDIMQVALHRSKDDPFVLVTTELYLVSNRTNQTTSSKQPGATRESRSSGMCTSPFTTAGSSSSHCIFNDIMQVALHRFKDDAFVLVTTDQTTSSKQQNSSRSAT